MRFVELLVKQGIVSETSFDRLMRRDEGTAATTCFSLIY